MYVHDIHCSFDTNLNMYYTQHETFKTCKMQSMSQGYTLFCYRGMEEGETHLGWIVREGTVKKSTQGEENKMNVIRD